MIHFSNNSEGEQYYHWEFSNGEELYTPNPQSVFEYNTVYEITLEVENKFSCLDQTSQKLEIPLIKPIYIANVFTRNNNAKNDTFHSV